MRCQGFAVESAGVVETGGPGGANARSRDAQPKRHQEVRSGP